MKRSLVILVALLVAASSANSQQASDPRIADLVRWQDSGRDVLAAVHGGSRDR